jgi:hypothetical protein
MGPISIAAGTRLQASVDSPDCHSSHGKSMRLVSQGSPRSNEATMVCFHCHVDQIPTTQTRCPGYASGQPCLSLTPSRRFQAQIVCDRPMRQYCKALSVMGQSTTSLGQRKSTPHGIQDLARSSEGVGRQSNRWSATTPSVPEMRWWLNVRTRCSEAVGLCGLVASCFGLVSWRWAVCQELLRRERCETDRGLT